MDQKEAITTARIFEEIIESCDQRLLFGARNGDVFCSLPQFMITKFQSALRQMYGLDILPGDSTAGFHQLIYRGIKFVPGYEPNIVVYHDSYYQYNEPWMINRVPVSSFIQYLNAV